MISSTVVRNAYQGSGSSGPFAFSYKIFAASDLLVQKTDSGGGVTALAYPSDFSVTGIGDAAGGSITLTTALAAGASLSILRAAPNTQPTDFRSGGQFLAAVHEDAFDRLAMQVQDLADASARSLKLHSAVDPAGFTTDVSLPIANQVMAWKADGTGFEPRTVDTASAALVPGDNRTAASLTDYLANNAVANVFDYGAVGDGAADDTAAFLRALASGRPQLVSRPGATHKITSLLPVNRSRQRLSGFGATLAASGSLTSVFHVGNNGSGSFVKTDDVTIEDWTFTGQADGTGSPGAPPFAIGVFPPAVVPYVEGAGCSRITVRRCQESGFCFGLVATGADHVTVEDFTVGGNYYYAGLSAGGYGVLLQTCFRATISRIKGTATIHDRHAIYISADPGRTFDNNNVCKHIQVIDPDLDWTGILGAPTEEEAVLVARSPENFTLSGGIIRGGYGGIDYDGQNGNGKNFIVNGTVFDGTFAGANERGCIDIIRSAGSYILDGVTITGCTFKPSGALMHGVVLLACNNVNVSGNTGEISASISLVQVAGLVTNAYLGGNTWNNNAQFTYQFNGAGNANITLGVDQGTLLGGGQLYNFATTPTGLLSLANPSGVNAMGFGALPGGAIDAHAQLAAANAAIVAAGGGRLIITAVHRVSTSITFDATVTLVFQGVGALSIDTGVTVTANGPVVALDGLFHTGLGTMTCANPTNWFGNAFGYGFGTHEPNNSDDYFHLERSFNGATGILVKNRTEDTIAESFVHIYGGDDGGGNGSDLQMRAQSKTMGGNVNIVGGNGTSVIGTMNVIQSSNKTLNLYANNLKVVEITPTASTVNYIALKGSATGSGVNISAAGIDANVNVSINSHGTGSISLRTADGASTQFIVTSTASATHAVSVTGSNGGNPVVDVTGGALRLSAGTNDIQWGKALVALGGGAAPALGTIGGTGPATAAQNSWMRVLDSTGTAFWVPAWK